MPEQPEPDTEGGPHGLHFGASVRHDLLASTWPQRLLLMATVWWIAYEWGFGNETLTPWILVRVISNTSGAASVIAVASVGFVFTTLQQLLSGHIAVVGFSMFDRTADAAWDRLRPRLDERQPGWSGLPLPTRALLVFTLGTTAVVLMQVMVTGDADPGRHRGVVNQAAVLCGLLVGAVGGGIAGAVWVGRSVPALEPATEWLIRVLGNPLFWIGLLVVVLTVSFVRRRLEQRRPGASTPLSTPDAR